MNLLNMTNYIHLMEFCLSFKYISENHWKFRSKDVLTIVFCVFSLILPCVSKVEHLLLFTFTFCLLLQTTAWRITLFFLSIFIAIFKEYLYFLQTLLVVERVDMSQEHPLALLAEELKKLLKKDSITFMPVLSQRHPQATVVSASLVHKLYGNRLVSVYTICLCFFPDHIVEYIFEVTILFECISETFSGWC